MGLNHDLLLLQSYPNLETLLDHLSNTHPCSSVLQTFQMHYRPIIQCVLERDYPSCSSVQNTEIQRQILICMCFLDQSPSGTHLAARAEAMPRPSRAEERAPPPPPQVPFLRDPVSAVRSAVAMATVVRGRVLIDQFADISRGPCWRLHLWEGQVLELVARMCFKGSKGRLRSELGVFGTRRWIGRLVYEYC